MTEIQKAIVTRTGPCLTLAYQGDFTSLPEGETVFAPLSASPVDLDAVKREAASKAWDAAMAYAKPSDCFSLHTAARDRYLAKTYPAPAPDRVELSDGSVVTIDEDGVELSRNRIPNEALTRVAKPKHWPLLIPDLTGADFDKLQAFVAARVGGQP